MKGSTQVTLRWMYDASVPPANPPRLYCVAGYIGGNTPHVWTLEEWRNMPSPYGMPIFTASDREDSNAAAIIDAATISAQLVALGVAPDKTVVVDIETRVYDNYLDELNERLTNWRLMAYGSVSTLVGNIKPRGGWWGAHWTDNIETGIDAVESGEFLAMQWADDVMLGKPYDLSVISSTVPLWVKPHHI